MLHSGTPSWAAQETLKIEFLLYFYWTWFWMYQGTCVTATSCVLAAYGLAIGVQMEKFYAAQYNPVLFFDTWKSYNSWILAAPALCFVCSVVMTILRSGWKCKKITSNTDVDDNFQPIHSSQSLTSPSVDKSTNTICVKVLSMMLKWLDKFRFYIIYSETNKYYVPDHQSQSSAREQNISFCARWIKSFVYAITIFSKVTTSFLFL